VSSSISEERHVGQASIFVYLSPLPSGLVGEGQLGMLLPGAAKMEISRCSIWSSTRRVFFTYPLWGMGEGKVL